VSSFFVFCAVMIVAAIALVLVPLLRPQAAPAKGQAAPAPATVAAVVMALVLPLAAVALYSKLTTFPWSDPRAVEAAPAHGEDVGSGEMGKAIAQLEERLRANPTDAEGWRMLGRSYLMAGRSADAVAALDKAIVIVGDQDPALQLDLAEAIVLSADPARQDRAKQILDAALAERPDSQKALWYSGVMAYKAGDKVTTKARWSKLLELNPPDEIRKIITQQLAQLDGSTPAGAAAPASGVGPSMGASQGAAEAPQGRTIKVAVSLDPSLAAKLKPGMPLFVAARQPGIPGPPLAAVRLTSDELPTTVVLSDANSMIEGRNLSSVDDVEVVAHVAIAGTPMVASGDLVGTGIQKKGGPPELQIAISKVQP
jgi:cytochrome c-type biogenesis protein CcmH